MGVRDALTYRRRRRSSVDMMDRIDPEDPLSLGSTAGRSFGRSLPEGAERMRSVTREFGGGESVRQFVGDEEPTPRQSVRGALKERGGRYTLLSAEGMRRHPVASAVVHGALYGARGGEVAKRTVEDDRRRQLEEEDREERRQLRADREAERQANRGAPVPPGMWRDPATARVHNLPKGQEEREPNADEITAMSQAGKVWDPVGKKFVSRGKPAGTEGMDENAQEAPPGTKIPKGFVWVPGKGLQRDPTFEHEPKGRTEHQVRTDIVVNQTRKKTLADAASKAERRLRLAEAELQRSGDEDGTLSQEIESLRSEAEQYRDSIALIDAEVQSSEGELQSIVPEGPLGYEEYDQLSDKEKQVYRMKFKMPKKPVGYGTVLKPGASGAP